MFTAGHSRSQDIKHKAMSGPMPGHHVSVLTTEQTVLRRLVSNKLQSQICLITVNLDLTVHYLPRHLRSECSYLGTQSEKLIRNARSSKHGRYLTTWEYTWKS